MEVIARSANLGEAGRATRATPVRVAILMSNAYNRAKTDQQLEIFDPQQPWETRPQQKGGTLCEMRRNN
jgi:hypothetical protein